MAEESRTQNQGSKIRRVGDRPPKDDGRIRVDKPSSPLRSKEQKVQAPSSGKDPQVNEGGSRLGQDPAKEAELKHSQEAKQKNAEEAARDVFQKMSGQSVEKEGKPVEPDPDMNLFEAMEEELEAELEGREPEMGEKDEEDAPRGENDPIFDKALDTLRRAKVAESTIKGLSREAALDMAAALGDVMAERERNYQQSQNALKALEALGDKQSTEEPSDGKAGQPSEADLQALRKPLDTEFGSDVVDALMELVKAAQPPPPTDILQRLDAHEAELTGMSKAAGREMVANQRDRLQEGLRMQGAYPQVAEGDVWSAVVKNAEKLAQSGQFDNPDACFLAAAAMTIGPAASTERSRKRPKTKAKADGQVPAGNQRPGHQMETGDNAENQARKVFRYLNRKPGDVRGARAYAER